MSDAFRADVNNADPEYIIQKYGTHVLTNIYLGGGCKSCIAFCQLF
ncbi:MAG: MAC/perforin domain-containing protein [Odoribacter splanchnicus]